MPAYQNDYNTCTLPPPLDDRDLLAALDHDLDQEAQLHLRTCPYCSGRAKEFDRFQRALQNRLFRLFCPSSDDLLCFQQRVINPERYVAIANHLKDCVHCQRELNLLERAAALPVSFQPINLRPDDQIALSLERHRFFAITSATSAPIGEQYVYRAEHARLLISVERLRNQANRRILNGHLALSNALRYQPGTTASILCGSEIIESTLIDPYGCFILDDLPAGIHTLSLRLAGCELIIDSLRI